MHSSPVFGFLRIILKVKLHLMQHMKQTNLTYAPFGKS